MRRLARNGRWPLFLALFGLAAPLGAGERASSPGVDGAGWHITGDAAPDAEVKRDGGAAQSLRLGPKSVAEWRFGDVDTSGRVDFFVREDNQRPANPAANTAGPRWGLVNADGGLLAVSVLYARYLGNGDTYVPIMPQQANVWHSKLQYVGERRTDAWTKWSFVVDDQGEVSLLRDDKPVARFTDKDMKAFGGFRGVRLYGDATPDANNRLWVDSVTAAVGVPVAKPAPKPYPQTPDADPAEADAPALKVAGHPRLFFTAEELPALRQKLDTPEGQAAFAHLKTYLGGSLQPQPNTSWATNDEQAQREGFWKTPTLVLYYALTGDEKAVAAARQRLENFEAVANWGHSIEQNTSMGAGNVLFGAALLYDTFHDRLDPEFREKVRAGLLLRARALYHEGHLRKAGQSRQHYWQGDPSNNHRWHRAAGLTAAALAAYEPDRADARWIAARVKEELDYIHRWLPADGSYHDSATYLVFGAPYLVIAFEAADRALGTDYMSHPWFSKNALFRLHSLTPNMTGTYNFGDGGGNGFFNNYYYSVTARSRDANEQAGVRLFQEKNPGAFAYGWPTLLWLDASLAGGDINRLHRAGYFPDLGAAYFRDGWVGDGARVGLAFKCGPMGGYMLNKYRNQDPNALKYINVAHDHPDTNSFQLYADGEMIATDDNYPKPRNILAHNAVLVDGKGHAHEWGGYSQPWNARGKQVDMTRGGLMVGVNPGSADDPAAAFAGEGEAAGSYAALDRFRRAVVFVPGGYVLVLDDLRAPKETEFTWLFHSPKIVEQSDTAWRIGDKQPKTLRLAAQPPVADRAILPERHENLKSDPAPRGDRLEAKAKGAAVRFVALIDAWGHGDAEIADLKLGDAEGSFTVRLKGRPDERYTWKYAPATAAAETPAPSELVRAVNGKQETVMGAAFRVDPRGDIMDAR